MALIFACLSGCDTGGNMKGVLSVEELAYMHNVLEPQLVKAGVCSSTEECDNNYYKYLTCSSHNALTCYIYGLTDKKMIGEILISMMNSGLRFGKVEFWRYQNGENGFFDKPIVMFVDRSWES